MDPSNKFKHTVLSDPSRQIRLLTLNPHDDGESIACSLNVFDSDSIPAYTALSYEWGPRLLTEHVSLNGFRFNVRQNLFDFLTEYKRAQRSGSKLRGVLLFIDQLCIDQKSIPERRARVARMGEIFRKANRTIAWLRDKEMKSDAHVAMPELVELFDKLHGKDSSKIWQWQSLCRRAYWSRVWIVQELILSRTIVVWDGTERIQWSSFDTLLKIFNEKSLKTGMLRSSSELCTTPLVALLSARSTRKTSNLALQTIISRFEGTSCSDPRDTVYALLRVVSDNKGIVPNYNQDARALFQEVTIACAPGGLSLWSYERFCHLLARRLRQPEKLAADYCQMWKQRFEERIAALLEGTTSFSEQARLNAGPAAMDAWNSVQIAHKPGG